MKKLFKKLAVLTFMFVPVIVNAQETANAEDLQSCVQTADSICQLTSDIELSAQLSVTAQVTIDLNNHSITPTASLELNQGLVMVHRGATLTVTDNSEEKGGKISTDIKGSDTHNSKVIAGVQLTKLGENDETIIAKLIVNGGTIEGYSFGITGNGNRHGTEILITDGTISAIGSNSSVGIYHPQEGKLTINGGEITGETGIEIRSGELIVTGGTITGTGVPTEVTPNGNGSTTYGSGVAVAQHTTLKPISVRIENGTIKGYTAFYESNPQGNSAEDIAKVTLSISGGTFESISGGEVVVYSQDKTEFVTNGNFTPAIEEKYLADEENISKADYTKIDQAIASLYEADYYVDFSAVQEIIDEVNNSNRPLNFTYQSYLDELLETLQVASALLELKPANYEELNAKVTEYSQLNSENYVSTTEVETVLAKINSSENQSLNITEQSVVDSLLQELTNAMNNLVFKDADYTALNAKVKSTLELTKTNYTDFSKVEAVLEKINSSENQSLNITEQSVVDSLLEELTQEVENLVLKKADYTQANAALENAKKVDKTKYTAASYAALESAMKAIVMDLDITAQVELDKATIALNDAYNSLVELLEEPVVYVPTIDLDEEIKEIIIAVADEEKTQDILLDSLKDSELYDETLNMGVFVDIISDEYIDIEEEVVSDIVSVLESKVSENVKVAKYFDISLNVYNVDGFDFLGNLSEVKKPIALTVGLPEELKTVETGYVRNYYVVRYHDGKSEIIDAKVSEDGKSLTFESDKFSIYAIAYNDVVAVNPGTYDGITSSFVIGAISLIGLISLAFYFKKQNN